MRNVRSRLGRLSLLAVLATALSLGAATPSFALTGSTFEGNDGNLVVDTSGNTDWANAPNRVRGDDLSSDTNDNSFGQGTKEDNADVTVVSGSIPPNKSDLTRFYVASESASGNSYLYLAWERANVLGTANMDFEINQVDQTTSGLDIAGQHTITRTAGDLLVTYDFTNGGGNPVLGLLKWVTSGPTSQCFSSNSLPCWGNRVDLRAAGFAEGAVNTATVTDTIALPGLTFGEAAINLTAVFPAGQCEVFASAFLKSRSSASFTAEVKDFVAPQPVHLSNCEMPTATPTDIPTAPPTDTATATPTNTATATATNTATATPTDPPTATNTATATPTAPAMPTDTATPVPSSPLTDVTTAAVAPTSTAVPTATSTPSPLPGLPDTGYGASAAAPDTRGSGALLGGVLLALLALAGGRVRSLRRGSGPR